MTPLSNANQCSTKSNHSSPLGSVSLLKVDKPKLKEKLKISSSIIAPSITPTSGTLSNTLSTFSKRNKIRNTNVHVEFAPTNIKPNPQRHLNVTTSLISKNLLTSQNLSSHPTSNMLQSQPEKRTIHYNKPKAVPIWTSIVPSSPPVGGGAIDQHGFIYDKELADKRTREILDRGHQDSSTCGYTMMDVDTMRLGNANNVRGRKQERCQCPNCMDPNRDPEERRAATLHSCHYADCGKKYKKTSHLRAHLRWHVGDQPFMCSWKNCGKRLQKIYYNIIFTHTEY